MKNTALFTHWGKA